jgi:hypothetical protein
MSSAVSYLPYSILGIASQVVGKEREWVRMNQRILMNCTEILAVTARHWALIQAITRPLVREGAPQKQDRKFQTATFRQEVISGRKSHKGAPSLTRGRVCNL